MVHAGLRRTVGDDRHGPVEALLPPDLPGAVEAIHATFRPGAAHPQEFRRDTRHPASIASATRVTGAKGDRHRIRGQARRWPNACEHPAVAVRVIAPPVQQVQ